MQHALLIAEKPDLMRKIRDVYEKNSRKIPYDITFTSQRGHLVTLLSPDEMNEDLAEWSWDTLPIHPEDQGGWRYKVIKEKKTGNFMTSEERYDLIAKAIKSGDYDFIINAGDPDQEGELLVRLVLRQAGNKLPVKRFWTNDLTETHILNALKNLRDDDNDPQLVRLMDAALGRQHSDYRFGMNISRAASLKMEARVACGRVKTPILAIVCRREEEIENFIPRTMYGLKAIYSKGFEGTLYSEKQAENDRLDAGEDDEEAAKNAGVIWFDTEAEAKRLADRLENDLTVIRYEAKRQETFAPKLYKLASIQIDAGRKYGYNAADTLRIIQGLYEKKYVSYPRTSCEYLGGEEDLRAMLDASCAVPDLREHIDTVTDSVIEQRRGKKAWFNPAKLQDEGHSALVPTGIAPDWDELEEEEKHIYSMIAKRFAQIFLPPLVQDKAVMVSESSGHKTFRSTGKTLVSPGWTVIEGREFTDNMIPRCEEGDRLEVDRYEITKRTTTCPKRYSTADLISVCENPSAFLDNKELKKMKVKIGTPATRASIIQELITHDKYLKVVKKDKREVIQPTPIGREIINNIRDCDIAKVDMTAEMEQLLEEVRSGGAVSLPDLEAVMIEHVNKMTQEIKNKPMKSLADLYDGYRQLGKCPVCGKMLMRGPARFYCSGYKEGCKAGGAREKYGVKLSDEDFLSMLRGNVLEKEAEKDGHKWIQRVECSSSGQIIFRMEEKATGMKCPVCGKEILETPVGYRCEGRKDDSCGVYLSKSVAEVEIPREQVEKLFTKGETDVIEGFKSKKKKSFFSARFFIDKAEKNIGMKFEDPERPTDYLCPVCGMPVIRKGRVLECSSKSCHFGMYGSAYDGTDLPPRLVEEMLRLVHDGEISGGEEALLTFDDKRTPYKCPVCGKKILRRSMQFKCEDTEDCGFHFGRLYSGYVLDDTEVEKIFKDGRTDVIERFVSTKSGKNFSASLEVSVKDKKIVPKFVETKSRTNYICPLCKKYMYDTGMYYKCDCGMEVGKKIAGATLTEKDLEELFKKGTTSRRLNMKGPKGSFSAKITINKAEKKTSFIDFGKSGAKK